MKKMTVFVMIAIVVGNADAKVVRQTRPATTVQSRPVVMPVVPTHSVIMPAPKIISAPTIDRSAIIKRLDDQLNVPVESAWNDRINDIFDLAMIDRDLARDYFVKMRSKMGSADVKSVQVEEKVVSTLPAGEEPMKKATGKPAPLRKPAVPKEGTTGTSQADVLSGEQMSKGALPAPKKGAPSRGPAKNIGVTKSTNSVEKKIEESIAKKPAPLSVTESYSAARLDKASDDELIKLFEDLLVTLGIRGDFWNGKEVPQKPALDWDNKINGVKKALMKRPGIAIDYDTVINNRIKEVREIKKQEGLVRLAEREKQPASEDAFKENLTAPQLINKIETQFKKKDLDFKWAIETRGAIQKLYVLDPEHPEKALAYEEEYVKKSGNKKFLQVKKNEK